MIKTKETLSDLPKREGAVDAKTPPSVISVILPIYNVAPYIRKSLDSLLGQTYRELEIICVDDGSTDSTPEVLAEYAAKDSRVKVVRQENAGPGSARNKGLSMASGEYVIFVDPDDWCSPQMMESLHLSARKYNSDVAICSFRTYDAKSHVMLPWRSLPGQLVSGPQPFSALDCPRRLFSLFEHTPWNKMWKREFLLSLGTSFQSLQRAEDVFFIDSALSCARRISLVNKPLYIYRRGREGSAQATNDVSPFSVCHAYAALLAFLHERELWDRLQWAFRIAAFASLRYTLLSLRTHAMFLELYDAIRGKWLNELDLLPLLEEKTLSVFLQDALKAIIENESPVPFLMLERAMLDEGKAVQMINSQKQINAAQEEVRKAQERRTEAEIAANNAKEESKRDRIEAGKARDTAKKAEADAARSRTEAAKARKDAIAARAAEVAAKDSENSWHRKWSAMCGEKQRADKIADKVRNALTEERISREKIEAALAAMSSLAEAESAKAKDERNLRIGCQTNLDKAQFDLVNLRGSFPYKLGMLLSHPIKSISRHKELFTCATYQ